MFEVFWLIVGKRYCELLCLSCLVDGGFLCLTLPHKHIEWPIVGQPPASSGKEKEIYI